MDEGWQESWGTETWIDDCSIHVSREELVDWRMKGKWIGGAVDGGHNESKFKNNIFISRQLCLRWATNVFEVRMGPRISWNLRMFTEFA